MGIRRIRAGRVEKDYLSIIIDEHSGDAGLLTRVESFTDMIKRKKDKEEKAAWFLQKG